MSVRFIRISHAYTTELGRRVFTADVEINGQPHTLETPASDIIEAIEIMCARLREDFDTEFDG
jgi:hypothetical protein